jgi:hypothetical protein
MVLPDQEDEAEAAQTRRSGCNNVALGRKGLDGVFRKHNRNLLMQQAVQLKNQISCVLMEAGVTHVLDPFCGSGSTLVAAH